MSHLITRRRSVTNAPPTLSASTAPCVSAPLNGEPTPTASQVPVSLTSSVSVHPLSARQPYRRRREPDPSDHISSASRVEAKKQTRGPSRMLKPAESVRLTGSKIKIEYDPVHRGAATAQQHSIVVSSCGVVIKQNCPMQWEKWAEIPDRTKDLVRDKLSVIFDLDDISSEVKAYLDETLATRYKHWKNYLHTHERPMLQAYAGHMRELSSHA